MDTLDLQALHRLRSCPTWDIVQKFLLCAFLGFAAFAVRSDLYVRGQLPEGPERVSEHGYVTHQHLLTEDQVDRVPDLSERRRRRC